MSAMVKEQKHTELTIYKKPALISLSKLTHHLENNATNPIIANGFALLLSAIAIAILYYNNFTFQQQRISLFLLFFPVVVLSSWYGGFVPGVISTILVTAGVSGIYYYQISHGQMFPLFVIIQLVIFLLEGFVISFLINKAKRFNLIAKYAHRERVQKKELFDLSQELTKAKKDIKSRDEFLSFVSHELKTPLTSMLLQSQAALHNIRNVSLANFSIEKLLKMLENSEAQTKQLAKMVNDLMNVSLITTGKLELEREEVDLGKLTETVINQMEGKLAYDGYEITTDIEDHVVGVWDRMRLEQVILNLFTNAIKYGDKKPIDIVVYQKNGDAKLVISDRGIGIPKDLQSKIFNRFERGSNAHQFEGLGVGLYLSSQIIKAHGGKIEVNSRPSKGSTFTITLPLEK
jgi:signal transduction histidine kinase